MNLASRCITVLLAASCMVGTAFAGAELDRNSLPIREPKVKTITEMDARNATAPPRFDVRAPQGAPNVVIVLIDDIGFGQSSAFGGPVHMPVAEKLANEGLRYNRFHTTALCSPTRTALLTGRNHHSNNAGSIMETATAFPGNTGTRPENITPLAEILRQNGYSTAAFGKYHETAVWEVSPSGPTDRWPTRSGFDKFYGFIGGETNQWMPLIYEDMTRIEPPHTANYHFTTDMTDHAINWVRYQQSLTPEKPFFIYYAPGATHAPHHAPKEWIAKYRGQFDGGWDRQRQETLARQKKLGVVPANAVLAPKPEFIKDWDKLSAAERKLFARQMEVFAGFAEHTDHEIGRLVDAIDELGDLDNTLFVYIIGDNGASAEGTAVGVFNEATYFNGVKESMELQTRMIDELGGPKANNHYAAGWAVAGNAPFEWTKQVAGSFGGTRNPMIMHWPKGIKAHGEVRSQFSHVIDIAPTVLEAANIPQPAKVNGIPQRTIEGTSLVYSFTDASAKERHTTQYFEIFGNRGIYSDGWFAGTVHRAPWEGKPRATLENDTWELYNTSEDFSLAKNLAAENPGKVKDMQGRFIKEAKKYNVLPLDDRTMERFNAALVGRPDLMGGRTSLTLYPGMVGMMENTFINVKNRSHSITAEVEVPTNANGVILAQGGRFAGWSLYMKAGRLHYAYNWLDMEHYDIAATEMTPKGKAMLRYEFAYDGGKPGSGGMGTLYVNDRKVGQGRIPKTVPMVFSADETADVGMDDATVVTEAYKERDNRFTGKIVKVRVDLKQDASNVAVQPANTPVNVSVDD